MGGTDSFFSCFSPTGVLAHHLHVRCQENDRVSPRGMFKDKNAMICIIFWAGDVFLQIIKMKVVLLPC